jgi:hypothetical protein
MWRVNRFADLLAGDSNRERRREKPRGSDLAYIVRYISVRLREPYVVPVDVLMPHFSAPGPPRSGAFLFDVALPTRVDNLRPCSSRGK